MAKYLALGPSDKFYEALVEHGVLPDGMADSVARVVIDLQAGQPAKIYVAAFADDDTLDAELAADLVVMAAGD